MAEVSYVVVFPTVFAKNNITDLISNIKKILKIRNQEFQSIKRDGEVILINSTDPVFASSAISLIFGIERVAIARKVENDFKTIVSEITTLGGNLLLKGEKFLVKVEGTSKGFFTKDIELAATSSIIEKKAKLGAIPGTENEYNKLLYTYLTKNNAYICIFIDKGQGGKAFTTKQNTVCCIFDELSAISCFETIKQGYDTKIIICYRKRSELINLVKTVNQIIPRLLKEKITLDFYQLKVKSVGGKNYLSYINSIVDIMVHDSIKNKLDYISLPLSPLIFSQNSIKFFTHKIFQNKKTPIIPLFGSDDGLFENAKEIGLEKNIQKIYRIFSMDFKETSKNFNKDIIHTLNTKETVTVRVGPNNVHDILDTLQENH